MSSNESEVRAGALYVVATPIGNLGDLSPRAQRVLAGVSAVLAEDTRVTGSMLAHFGIQQKLIAVHDHNETEMCAGLVARLQRRESFALVSDAGTPLISDPGFSLVRAARAAKVPVLVVPGPSAAVAALSISGLPTDAFVFCGFLPAKAGARLKALQERSRESRTLVFYESSHRIGESLQALTQVLGGSRRACISRELTKMYEESYTANLEEISAWLTEDENRTRGEFVLVIQGAESQLGDVNAEQLLRILLAELPPSRAARVASEISGGSKKEIYALAVKLAGRDDTSE